MDVIFFQSPHQIGDLTHARCELHKVPDRPIAADGSPMRAIVENSVGWRAVVGQPGTTEHPRRQPIRGASTQGHTDDRHTQANFLVGPRCHPRYGCPPLLSKSCVLPPPFSQPPRGDLHRSWAGASLMRCW